VFSSIEIEDEESAPFCDLRGDVESAVLMEGVASIFKREFCNFLRLKSIQIPKTVTSIGDGTFDGCISLKTLAITDSVETIGFKAFAKCPISSIKVPRSVVSFGGNPFIGCRHLKAIDISENPNFVFEEGVLMDKEMTQIIYCSPSKSGGYSIQNTVTAVCASAFERCGKLTSITIPDSIVHIGKYAFLSCYELASIVVSGPVTTIDVSAFE